MAKSSCPKDSKKIQLLHNAQSAVENYASALIYEISASGYVLEWDTLKEKPGLSYSGDRGSRVYLRNFV
jgi:hypothetical protein